MLELTDTARLIIATVCVLIALGIIAFALGRKWEQTEHGDWEVEEAQRITKIVKDLHTEPIVNLRNMTDAAHRSIRTLSPRVVKTTEQVVEIERNLKAIQADLVDVVELMTTPDTTLEDATDRVRSDCYNAIVRIGNEIDARSNEAIAKSADAHRRISEHQRDFDERLLVMKNSQAERIERIEDRFEAQFAHLANTLPDKIAQNDSIKIMNERVVAAMSGIDELGDRIDQWERPIVLTGNLSKIEPVAWNGAKVAEAYENMTAQDMAFGRDTTPLNSQHLKGLSDEVSTLRATVAKLSIRVSNRDEAIKAEVEQHVERIRENLYAERDERIHKIIQEIEEIRSTPRTAGKIDPQDFSDLTTQVRQSGEMLMNLRRMLTEQDRVIGWVRDQPGYQLAAGIITFQDAQEELSQMIDRAFGGKLKRIIELHKDADGQSLDAPQVPQAMKEPEPEPQRKAIVVEPGVSADQLEERASEE